MDGGNSREYSRTPELEDLVKICALLNEQGAQYLVCGGFAIIQHGFPRFTGDIDLLIEPSQENQRKVREAMMQLPDQAIKEIKPTDLDEFIVLRVADEVVVDLMKAACGIEYKEASKEICVFNIRGVDIPFASPRLLWRMKQTHRAKDEMDLVFLRELLKKEE
jgi:hypothetical protein